MAHLQESTDQKLAGLYIWHIKFENLESAAKIVSSEIRGKIERLFLPCIVERQSWIMGRGHATLDEEITGPGCAGIIVSSNEKAFLERKKVPGVFSPVGSEHDFLIHF